MIKNSIIYRRIWYMKRRNSKRLYVYFRLLSIVIILASMLFYAKNYSLPYIAASTEQRVKSIIEAEARDALSDLTADEGSLLLQGNILTSEGMLSSLSTERAGIDGFAWEISKKLEKRLNSLEIEGIRLPAGVLLGDTIFSKLGPEICFKSKLINGVYSQVKSESSHMDADRIQHKVYLNVHVKVGFTVFLKERELDIKTNLPIIEKIVEQDKI